MGLNFYAKFIFRSIYFHRVKYFLFIGLEQIRLILEINLHN